MQMLEKYKNKIKTFISWVSVLLWMLLIYNLSAQVVEQSNELSKEVTKSIVEKAIIVAPDLNIDLNKFNHLLRKNAHFFVYFVLGIFVMNAIRILRVSKLVGVNITFLICVLYAVSDEVHQLYVPGRGGQVKDVLIDSAGATVGILIYKVLNNLIEAKRFRALHSCGGSD